jgi:hypothetical protein
LNVFKERRTLRVTANLNAFEKGARVDIKFGMYLLYLALSIVLTIWVAGTLSRNGLVFLEDVFDDHRLARAVNRLLVVGFYLVNLGYVAVALQTGKAIDDANEALEELSRKIGLVLLVLGALHFFNVFALGRYRRSRLRQNAPYPPLPPAGRLPMPPPPYPPPPYPPPPYPGAPAVPGAPGTPGASGAAAGASGAAAGPVGTPGVAERPGGPEPSSPGGSGAVPPPQVRPA